MSGADTQDKPEGIFVDGELVTVDDLTFRELDTATDLIREISGSGHLELEDAHERYFLPAVITVIKRRKDPGFTVEQARDMKAADLEPPRPTKPAAKRKAAAGKP